MSDIERRLATTLKGVSERHLDEAPRRPGAAQREITRRVRRRWGLFVLGASAVTALALTALTVSVPQLLSERTQFPSGGAQLVPVTTTIEIGNDPVAIAADDEAVWVALGNGFVRRIDAANNEDISNFEVAPSLTDVAVGAGQVWAAGELQPGLVSTPTMANHALYRLLPSDPDQVAFVLSDEPRSLAVTPESVWSVFTEPNAEGGTLHRFSLGSDDEQQASGSESGSTEWRPEGIVADGDSIWTVGTDGGSVIRQLDGVTGEVRRGFIGGERVDECNSCPPASSSIAVGDASVVGMWEGRETIALVDERKDEVRLSDAAGQLGETRAVAISEGEAWVVIEKDRVARIDLESGELIGEPIEVGPNPVDIAAGAGAVWTINRGNGTVTRIDLVEPDPAPVERATPDDEASPEEEPSPAQPSPSPTPGLDDPVDGLDVDAQMGELIDAVGAPCGNFDFQYKEDIEGRIYRPAFCNDGTQRILLFSFATEEDRRAWADGGRESEFSLTRRGPIVVGPTWEAHVIDANLAREVAAKLEAEAILWREDEASSE
jgi:hypothetical protein